MKLFCFIFAVLCYFAGREVIIIPPFMYKSIHFPKVSQRTLKTKGLISIEGTFFWDTLYSQLLNLVWNCIDTGHKMFLECFIYRHLPRGAI